MTQRVSPEQGQELSQPVGAELLDGPLDALLCGLEVIVMVGDQKKRLAAGGVIKTQAAHDGVCEFCAFGRVAVKMANAVPVKGKGGGLSKIMEQGGPAEGRFRRSGGNHRGGVAPNVMAVVGVVLVKPHGGGDLRDRDRQHIGVLQQDRFRVSAAEQLCQLPIHPFGRKAAQKRPVFMERGSGAALNDHTVDGGKPQCPKDAQRILPKPPVSLAHAAQDALLQILQTAEAVDDPAPFVQSQCVYREVPAGQVVVQRHAEGDAVRVPPVGVAALPPEGGDLDGGIRYDDGDRAVAAAGEGGPGEEGENGLRRGGGGHVPVAGSAAQQQVTDAAPHGIGGVSGLSKGVTAGGNRLRQHDFLGHMFHLLSKTFADCLY